LTTRCSAVFWTSWLRIASHPERLQAVDLGLVQRLQSLVAGIKVDLDSSLSAHVE
jgi:antitoxin PrlF